MASPAPGPSSQVRPASPEGSAASPKMDPDASSVVDVDQDMDELVSDTEAPPASTTDGPLKSGQAQACKWEGCTHSCNDPTVMGKHLQRDHLGPATANKVWTCEWDECPRRGQKQSSRHSLVVHCRMHTGERPYECTFPGCSSTFTRSDALNKHTRTLHANPDRQPRRKKDKDKATTATASAHPLVPRLPPLVLAPLPETPIKGEPLQYDWEKAASAGLFEDADLAEVVQNVQNISPFWVVSEADQKAADAVRARNPHKRFTVVPTGTDNGEEEDDFDEGVSRLFPFKPQTAGKVASPEDPAVGWRVLTRPRWQVRYIMAKAKLMLVEEENRMRRSQLEELMELEKTLRDKLTPVPKKPKAKAPAAAKAAAATSAPPLPLSESAATPVPPPPSSPAGHPAARHDASPPR